MEIFYEDACAGATFLSGSKIEVSDLEVVFTGDAKTVTPFFELSDSNCSPTMTLGMSDTDDDYVNYEDVSLSSDYVASVTTDAVTFGSSVSDSLETVKYYQLVMTIEGSEVADTEDSGMLTYEFSVTYLHQCAHNELTRVGDTVAYKYFVETDEVHEYAPNVINSVSGCTHEAVLYFDTGAGYEEYDADTHDFVTAFDAETGELVVDADSFSGFEGSDVDIPAKIVFTDPNSITDDNSVDDLFEVTLTNPCSAATVAWDGTISD
jgi:hypothetical protein